MSLLLLSLLFGLSKGAIDADEVTNLPGWDGDLPSKQYSGYLYIPGTNPGRFYHYWHVLSENDPDTDPIVFWFNGGPGASSLLGFFTENGPFIVNDYSDIENTTSIPKLFYNNYTWSKYANMVFLESPAGVGYSYCNGTAGPIESCPNWNDTSTAKDNHDAIQVFFKGFPEYMTHDFYIAGESYAGIYVPTLVMQIEDDPTGMPPLKGFAVGDGCMGIGSMGGCGLDDRAIWFKFMYGHGQISTPAYEELLTLCGNCLHYANCTSTECANQQQAIYKAVGGYNVYNIYDQCALENDEVTNPSVFTNKYGHVRFNLKNAFGGMLHHKLRNFEDSTVNPGWDSYVCGGDRVTHEYLQFSEVKTAIHVAQIPWTWQDGNWNKYTSNQGNLSPFYQKAVEKYRILIYYGDTDSAVSYLGGEEWTSNLGYAPKEVWRPWTVDGQEMMAGYVQVYNTPTNFTYLTVRGAGHEVPMYRPREALKMFECFLKDLPYPAYNGPWGPQ